MFLIFINKEWELIYYYIFNAIIIIIIIIVCQFLVLVVWPG